MSFKTLITLPGIYALTISCLAGQDSASLDAVRRGRQLLAEVTVIAFDTDGRFLGPPEIRLFQSDDGKTNIAPKFHAGTAEGVPYGTYRVQARLTAYSSDSRQVRVYQPKVTVVMGLTAGRELPALPPILSGRIVGRLPGTNSFVRLLGVYANISMDSAIDSEGHFILGGLTEGRYVLVVVSAGEIVAMRQITLPYSGSALEVGLSSSWGNGVSKIVSDQSDSGLSKKKTDLVKEHFFE